MSTPVTEPVDLTLTGTAVDSHGNLIHATVTVQVQVPVAQAPGGGSSPQQPTP